METDDSESTSTFVCLMSARQWTIFSILCKMILYVIVSCVLLQGIVHFSRDGGDLYYARICGGMLGVFICLILLYAICLYGAAIGSKPLVILWLILSWFDIFEYFGGLITFYIKFYIGGILLMLFLFTIHTFFFMAALKFVISNKYTSF